jgi:hypothetical protein
MGKDTYYTQRKLKDIFHKIIYDRIMDIIDDPNESKEQKQIANRMLGNMKKG